MHTLKRKFRGNAHTHLCESGRANVERMVLLMQGMSSGCHTIWILFTGGLFPGPDLRRLNNSRTALPPHRSRTRCQPVYVWLVRMETWHREYDGAPAAMATSPAVSNSNRLVEKRSSGLSGWVGGGWGWTQRQRQIWSLLASVFFETAFRFGSF